MKEQGKLECQHSAVQENARRKPLGLPGTMPGEYPMGKVIWSTRAGQAGARTGHPGKCQNTSWASWDDARGIPNEECALECRNRAFQNRKLARTGPEVGQNRAGTGLEAGRLEARTRQSRPSPEQGRLEC